MEALKIKLEDSRLSALSEIRDAETVYIWGGGLYAGIIREYLRSVGNYTGRFFSLVDDAYYTPGTADSISLSDFLRTGDKAAPVVFGFYNFPLIQKKKDQWADELPRMYDIHLAVVNGKRLTWDGGKAKLRESAYAASFELLSDERSKTCMQLYLNAATAGEFDALFTECHEPVSYFNRITEGLRIDTLIDCGAFDGDSIHDFVRVFPSYQRIIALEPDPENLRKLRQREAREGFQNLETIAKGVGASAGELRFKACGESNSFLDESGDQVIHITTLDEILAEKTEDLGTIFLKMDIEGSELDALHGAEKLIRERTPVMAICVYHREEDLIEIPQYIHRTAGAGVYDYFLGFHGLDLAELVFYAIPKKLRGV